MFKMVLVLFVFIVCLMNLIYSQGSCVGTDCPVYPGCQNYTRYTFALQNWQNGNTWQIHGLWPDYSSTCYPQYCHDYKYTPVTGSLRTEMLKYWNPNATDPDTFWSHELNRHGSCIAYYQPTINETGFFNEVLNLYLIHKNDITTICGEPKNDGTCYDICFDLNFNIISC